jgi:FkbM family methyltransferase
MKQIQAIRNVIRGFGYDVIKFRPGAHPLARRKKLFESYRINTVIDVGANDGSYGRKLRELGYAGKIISFEPLSSAYKMLENSAGKDANWEVYNYALGSHEASAWINIAGNSYSSSLLDMLPAHVHSAPHAKYIGREKIEIKTLDSVFSSVCSQTDRYYLKMDTQGFENEVINGGKNALKFIDTVQLEMSLVPLYKDGILFNEMYDVLFRMDYRLMSIEPGFTDKDSGQMLQIDGIFHRFRS